MCRAFCFLLLHFPINQGACCASRCFLDGNTESLLEVGELWTYAHSGADIAAGASIDLGILTGAVPVRVLARSYVSTATPMTIQLFEVSWTGGTAINQAYNRNRDYQAAPQPVQMLAGVTFTPNTPDVTVTVQSETGTGQARLSVTEQEPLSLKKNTRYVLRLTNSHNNLATLGCSITLRRKQASETLR